MAALGDPVAIGASRERGAIGLQSPLEHEALRPIDGSARSNPRHGPRALDRLERDLAAERLCVPLAEPPVFSRGWRFFSRGSSGDSEVDPE